MKSAAIALLYLRYHTLRNDNCESPMQQKYNRFMLRDGEIDHRQHVGNQSDSLQMNM